MTNLSFPEDIQIFLIALLSILLLRFILNRKQRKWRGGPPSPPSLPIIGHLHLLSSLPHQDTYNLSLRYGPIMRLSFGSVPCVVVSTAEAAREFLKAHDLCFSGRPKTIAIEYLSYGFQGFVFAPYGPYWKFIKKLCISELLGGRILDQFHSLRQQETLMFLRALLEKGKAGAEAVDVGAELMKLSNNIITRMAVSKSTSENEDEAHEIMKLMAGVGEMLGKFNISDFLWFCKRLDLQGFNKRVKEIRDRFDSLFDRLIQERQEQRRKRKEMGMGRDEVKDILEVLLDVYEDHNSEMRLTKDNIKAFILEIFMAGTDVSAIIMEWAMAELMNHPRVMARAREEIDSVIGKSRIVRESDIVKLPYLQAIVNETLRIHPGGGFIMRESREDVVVCGYEIPAKTRLFVNIWAIGRDPNHWVDPHEFWPERFMREVGGSVESLMDVKGQNYELISFGSGRRICPGASLAVRVVHTNLAAMIQCFDWKFEDGIEIVDMEEKAGMTLPRAHPLVCVPVPRLHFFPSTSF